MPLECYRVGKKFATLGEKGGEVTDPVTGAVIKYHGDDNPKTNISALDSRGKSVTKKGVLRELGSGLSMQAYSREPDMPATKDFFRDLPVGSNKMRVKTISVIRT